jgi:hypothetical protein
MAGEEATEGRGGQATESILANRRPTEGGLIGSVADEPTAPFTFPITAAIMPSKPYIERWLDELGVRELWERVCMT